MTYRLDSDISTPYGYISPKEQIYTYPPTQESLPTWRKFEKERFLKTIKNKRDVGENVKKKKKMVSWIVSRCGAKSKREKYVKELKEYIDVDIMGACSKDKKCRFVEQCKGIQCQRLSRLYHDKMDNCSLKVNNEFKFYLSFENSLCEDYVTEKFFLRMSYDVIPIVLGDGDYSKYAPPHSYIQTSDFDSPKELAEYLHYLNNNIEEYLSYFWWKDYYEVRMSRQEYAKSFCQLCQMLHDESLPSKTYYDIHDWWVVQGNCKPFNVN